MESDLEANEWGELFSISYAKYKSYSFLMLCLLTDRDDGLDSLGLRRGIVEVQAPFTLADGGWHSGESQGTEPILAIN